MKTTFCLSCGGAGFCQPTCRISSPEMQFHQRTLWYMRIMRDAARSLERKQHWTNEVHLVEAKLARISAAVRKAA